jgi:hypothetical protein
MKGYVCYIDLLGFSFLTTSPEIKNNQKIIHRYIKNLHKYCSQAIENTVINHCILSDSVFLFIENGLYILLLALARIFRNCISSGVLLRAGLTYGEYNYIKTEMDSKNIFGEAVTRAVSLEKIGKGCRIFIDDDLLKNDDLMNYNHNIIFREYKNYIDYSTINVFEWPVCYKDYCFKDIDSNSNIEPETELKELLYNNSKIISYLKYSPLFEWNAKNTKGKPQLMATIEYITAITNTLISNFNKYEIISYEDELENTIRKDKMVKDLLNRYKEMYRIGTR